MQFRDVDFSQRKYIVLTDRYGKKVKLLREVFDANSAALVELRVNASDDSAGKRNVLRYEMETEVFNKMKHESEGEDSQKKAISYAGRKRRTENEVRGYLRRKGFSDDTADTQLDLLKKYKAVDDKRLLDDYIEYLMNEKLASRMEIEGKLRVKFGGDLREEIRDRLNELYPAEREKEIVVRLAEKKKREYPDPDKLATYLMRHGFSQRAVRSLGGGGSGDWF